MWPLTRRNAAGRADPSPSRTAYKINRLLLSPLFRGTVKLGLPLAAMAALGGWIWVDEARRTLLTDIYHEARRSIEQRPEFSVRMLAVDGASPALAQEVRQTLMLDLPISSFDLELDKMRADIETLNPVATAQLQVRQGGVLQIQIEERSPVALWRTPAGELWTIDVTGHPIRLALRRADFPGMPLLSGEGADSAIQEGLAVLNAAAPLGDRVRGLKRRGERRWDVVLDRSQVIRLPDAAEGRDPVTALQRLIARDKAQDLFARDITIFDMRLPERPTLRLSQAATQEMLRIRSLESGGTP